MTNFPRHAAQINQPLDSPELNITEIHIWLTSKDNCVQNLLYTPPIVLLSYSIVYNNTDVIMTLLTDIQFKLTPHTGPDSEQ